MPVWNLAETLRNCCLIALCTISIYANSNGFMKRARGFLTSLVNSECFAVSFKRTAAFHQSWMNNFEDCSWTNRRYLHTSREHRAGTKFSPESHNFQLARRRELNSTCPTCKFHATFCMSCSTLLCMSSLPYFNGCNGVGAPSQFEGESESGLTRLLCIQALFAIGSECGRRGCRHETPTHALVLAARSASCGIRSTRLAKYCSGKLSVHWLPWSVDSY